MANILTTFPYPWTEKAAQDLHVILCELVPTGGGVVHIAQRVGFSAADFSDRDPARQLWIAVLQKAALARKTRNVVNEVLDENPDNPHHEFLQALLDDAPPPLLASPPRDAKGRPQFFEGQSEIKVPEALLFHDDLTLPVGRLNWLISVLTMLSQRASGICRLVTTFNEGIQNGTGFLVGPTTVLTNWHVVHHKGNMTTTFKAEFGYDDDGKGGGTASTAIDGKIASIRGDAEDDWALIDLDAAPPAGASVVKLADAGDPILDTPAFIIQHPGGDRKRVAYVRNQITHVDDRVVHYLSDTQAGSSGAPVFNDAGALVALHRAGGLPQEIAGKPPLRKNEGIRISRIRSKIASLGIAPPP